MCAVAFAAQVVALARFAPGRPVLPLAFAQVATAAVLLTRRTEVARQETERAERIERAAKVLPAGGYVVLVRWRTAGGGARQAARRLVVIREGGQ